MADTAATANSGISRAAPAAGPISPHEEVVISHIRRVCSSRASLRSHAGVLIAFFATAPAIATTSPPLPASAQR